MDNVEIQFRYQGSHSFSVNLGSWMADETSALLHDTSENGHARIYSGTDLNGSSSQTDDSEQPPEPQTDTKPNIALAPIVRRTETIDWDTFIPGEDERPVIRVFLNISLRITTPSVQKQTATNDLLQRSFQWQLVSFSLRWKGQLSYHVRIS